MKDWNHIYNIGKTIDVNKRWNNDDYGLENDLIITNVSPQIMPLAMHITPFNIAIIHKSYNRIEKHVTSQCTLQCRL